jgi:hypothetical protein
MGNDQGVYYLVKSPRLSVQARHSRVVKKATINTGFAIRFKDSVVTVTVKESPEGQTPCDIQQYGRKSGLTVSRRSAKSMLIRTEDGVIITMSFTKMKKRNLTRIDAHIQVPGLYAGQIDGLCGRFEAGENNADKGGEITKDNGEKYAVPANENLFQCHDKCSGLNQVETSAKSGHKCAITDIATGSGGGGGSTNATVSQESKIEESNVVVVPVIPPNVNDKESNEQYCKRVFDNLQCGKLDGSFYTNACVEDSRILQDMDSVVKPLMDAFQREW